MNESFDTNYLNTVGVDLKSVTLKINDTLARVNIWDTTGQEKFKSLVSMYFRNVSVAVVVFSGDDIQSFEKVAYWIQKVREEAPTATILLVQNKIDL